MRRYFFIESEFASVYLNSSHLSDSGWSYSLYHWLLWLLWSTAGDIHSTRHCELTSFKGLNLARQLGVLWRQSFHNIMYFPYVHVQFFYQNISPPPSHTHMYVPSCHACTFSHTHTYMQYSAIMSLVVLLEVAGVIYVVVQTQVSYNHSHDITGFIQDFTQEGANA